MSSLLRPSFLLLLLAAVLVAPRATGQTRYAVGDIVANFTLTDRATGRPVSLTDFAGKVVLLEWFAWWCPFCQAAAAQIEPGIVRYYAGRGGNAAGLPVLHVSVNLQPGQEAQTQQFVTAYRLGLVLNDFDRALANRFQSGGQPIFAVINGVAGSASHRPWELVFSQLGYGSTQAPIADLQRAIDSVRAPAPAPVTMPPGIAPLAIVGQPSPVTAAVGAPAAFAVTAVGPGTISYQWFRDGLALAGATAGTYAIAGVARTDAGDYSVRVTGPENTLTSDVARLTVVDPPGGATSRLSNLSVLTTLAPAQVLTVGFTLQGGTKPVLVRAAGPSLAALGVPDPLADPRLALFRGQDRVAANDNWSGAAALAATGAAVGAFPFASPQSLDAALVEAAEGGRSVQVSGVAAGNVIVEVYDAGAGLSARLVNLSALHRVEAGGLLTAGFTLSGTGTKTVLIRAVGPGLSPLGVDGVLADPKLAVFDAARVKVAENDDWAAGLAPAFGSVGAFGLVPGTRDAALLLTLAPGGYSAQVGSAGGPGGAVLVEIYEVP